MDREEKDIPLISVIVPVYNGQDTLTACVESIERQTYENLEIILVNDGSTDDTAAVCVRLRESFENLHVITTEGAGVSAARNAGIDASTGGILTFVDADDRLRPKTLQVLYECLRDTGSDMAGCGFFTWEAEEGWEGFLKEKYRIRRPREYTPGAYLREQLLKGNSRCWSKLYRRAAIGELRFSEELSIGEDMLFLLRLLPFLRKIAETDYPGYGYFRNPEGAMNREFVPRYMDQITCWELAREDALKMDPSLAAQTAALVMVGIMLTAGKLAELSFRERRKQKEYVRICHEKLKEEIGTPGACQELPEGYSFKVQMFLAMPRIYLFLYHLRKYR